MCPSPVNNSLKPTETTNNEKLLQKLKNDKTSKKLSKPTQSLNSNTYITAKSVTVQLISEKTVNSNKLTFNSNATYSLNNLSSGVVLSDTTSKIQQNITQFFNSTTAIATPKDTDMNLPSTEQIHNPYNNSSPDNPQNTFPPPVQHQPGSKQPQQLSKAEPLTDELQDFTPLHGSTETRTSFTDQYHSPPPFRLDPSQQTKMTILQRPAKRFSSLHTTIPQIRSITDDLHLASKEDKVKGLSKMTSQNSGIQPGIPTQ